MSTARRVKSADGALVFFFVVGGGDGAAVVGRPFSTAPGPHLQEFFLADPPAPNKRPRQPPRRCDLGGRQEPHMVELSPGSLPRQSSCGTESRGVRQFTLLPWGEEDYLPEAARIGRVGVISNEADAKWVSSSDRDERNAVTRL